MTVKLVLTQICDECDTETETFGCTCCKGFYCKDCTPIHECECEICDECGQPMSAEIHATGASQ